MEAIFVISVGSLELGTGELQSPTGPHLHEVEASNHLVELPCSAPLKMAINAIVSTPEIRHNHSAGLQPH